MHKRGRCRQYILISGQQLVCDAGWHTCHVNALGPQGAQLVCLASCDPSSCRAM